MEQQEQDDWHHSACFAPEGDDCRCDDLDYMEPAGLPCREDDED
ncbi:hypothetical protein ABZW10_28500 [Kitasatospora sp. NPDC004723]